MQPGGTTQRHLSLGVVILAAFLLLGGPSVAAAPGAAADRVLSGTIEVPADGLRIAAGEIVSVAPGSVLVGPGEVLVEGTLRVEGTFEQPVVIEVPLRVAGGALSVSHARVLSLGANSLSMEGGSASLEDVDFLMDPSVPMAAEGSFVTQRAGTLSLRDVEFEASADAVRWMAVSVNGGSLSVTGIVAEGGGRGLYVYGTDPSLSVTVAGSQFNDQNDAAVHLRGSGATTLRDSTLRGAVTGLKVVFDNAGADIQVQRVTFQANSQNVAVLQRHDATGDNLLRITGSTLGPLSTSAGDVSTEEPTLGVSLEVTSFVAADSPVTGTVILSGSTIHGASTGAYVRGHGIGFQAINSRFLSTPIGMYLDTTEAFLRGNTMEGTTYDFVLRGLASRATLGNYPGDLNKVYIEGSGVLTTPEGDILREAVLAARPAAAVGAGLIALVGFLWLYARLSPAQVLSHDKRKEIVAYLEQNPGAHLRSIGRGLNLTYGTLTYHLYRLEKEGIIVADEDGLFKKFYLSAGRGRTAVKESRPVLDGLRKAERDIFDAIALNPGSPQTLVAERLGLSRQALHYHIKKLEGQGLIRKVSQGRETLCYANIEPDAAASGAPQVPERGDLPLKT